MNEKNAIRDAIILLEEHIQLHADKNAPEYNACDTKPCAWCESAKATIAMLDKISKE